MRFLSLVPPVFVFGVCAAALVFSQPACFGHCAAAPTCEPGTVEVDECPKGGTCYEAEACGETILCMKDPACADAPCGAGTDVTTCPTGATCTTVERCGTAHLCQAAVCSQPSDCLSDEFCHFQDGRCGKGSAGECLKRPTDCRAPSVSFEACFCDGTIGDPCAGFHGADFDATGASCTPPPTAIQCAQLLCDAGTADYCTLGISSGAPVPFCALSLGACNPTTCACLTDFPSCTCADGPNGPTVTCPD